MCCNYEGQVLVSACSWCKSQFALFTIEKHAHYREILFEMNREQERTSVNKYIVEIKLIRRTFKGRHSVTNNSNNASDKNYQHVI